MSQYRQKPKYAIAILVAAVAWAFNAGIYARRGETLVATIMLIITTLWIVYSIWSLRMTYLRVESSGLTIRRGGLIGSGVFVGWGDITSANLNGSRLDITTTDGPMVTLRLSSLSSADREDFLHAFRTHVQLP